MYKRRKLCIGWKLFRLGYKLKFQNKRKSSVSSFKRRSRFDIRKFKISYLDIWKFNKFARNKYWLTIFLNRWNVCISRSIKMLSLFKFGKSLFKKSKIIISKIINRWVYFWMGRIRLRSFSFNGKFRDISVKWWYKKSNRHIKISW